MPKRYGQPCPVAKSLEFLGERWTLLIVRDLLGGPKKFRDLRGSLPGAAPAVLSDRLKVLETNGIIERGFYSDHPPRAAYALTPRGRELGTVIGALAVWGSRHVFADAPLVHDLCKTPVETGYYCPTCDDRVGASSVHIHRKSVVPTNRRDSPRRRTVRSSR